jgi:transposase-like protein
MRTSITRNWSDDDIARLIALSESGASVARAAAALNRRTGSVQKKARELGKPLLGTRQMRAAARAIQGETGVL